jgi:hypothetical protein
MALLTWDNDGGASSISSDETIGGLSGSDFEGEGLQAVQVGAVYSSNFRARYGRSDVVI